MKVKFNCEDAYRRERDPWGIGQADSERYDRYFDLVATSAQGGAVLDIGCGMGAFLARFHPGAKALVGVELSAIAIEKGRARFPQIEFLQGSAQDLESVEGLQNREFDLIICSDVINYFDDRKKLELLAWMSRHLTPDGVLFLAAYSPGGNYLTAQEFTRIARSHFVALNTQVFDTGHVALVLRNRRSLAALTVDYETWQPIPPGKVIDWEADIFAPADALAALGERCHVPVTFFVEMGEYFWLCANEPAVARRMERQWCDLAGRGHDLQLHLHPAWLPELGASNAGGDFSWDARIAKAADYPGDLLAVIGRCKRALEAVVRTVLPDYTVTCFRAGAYQAQPFARLYEALKVNGLTADSSVYQGGYSEERGYDYRHAYSSHQPYFASRYDPQLKAPPAEEGLLELPIFTTAPNKRCFIDGTEGDRFAEDFLNHLRRIRRTRTPGRDRAIGRGLVLWGSLYDLLRRVSPAVNRVLPRAWVHALTSYRDPSVDTDHYFVLIGHTKAELRLGAIERGLKRLRDEGGVEFVSLSRLAAHATTALASRRRGMEGEMRSQVRREYRVVPGEHMDSAQSSHLQSMIPLDRSAILDFGCGAGHRSARISELRSWARVVGVDAGEDFLRKARAHNASPLVTFCRADFHRLPFPDGAFDCVYADTSLAHSFDVDATLREIRRVLRHGGALIAALPADAIRPEKDCDNHTWKTNSTDVRHRLEQAGFSGIDVSEVDVLRELGGAPFPPSDDTMIYVRCWVMRDGYSVSARALHAMDWLYRHLSPDTSNAGWKVQDILRDGHAYCAGYASALGQILRHEAHQVRWLTMEAHGHHRGRGPQAKEHHAVVSLCIDGSWVVLDPMTNTLIPESLEAVLARPTLATVKPSPDARYESRGYRYYDTQYWYSRVVRYSYRSSPRIQPLIWRKNKWFAGTSAAESQNSRKQLSI